MDLLESLAKKRKQLILDIEYQKQVKEDAAQRNSWDIVKTIKQTIDYNYRLLSFIDKTLKDAEVTTEELLKAQEN